MGINLQSIQDNFISVLSVFTTLILWELIVIVYDIQVIYLPRPSLIATSLYAIVVDGELLYHLWITIYRTLGGFAIASALGILIGIFMGMNRIVALIFDTFISILYPLPKIALIPLLVIWLGTGEANKLTISALSAFFPIVINTFTGIRQVEKGKIKLAEDLGASKYQIQRHVILPASLPSIYSGLRLGLGVSIILVIAAEMIAGRKGLGFLLVSFGQTLQTEKVFAVLIVIAMFGYISTEAQENVAQISAPWAVKSKQS